MKRFRKVLVVVDTSEPLDHSNSLRRALKLAADTGAAIHVVDVIPEVSNSLRSWTPSDGDAVELATRRASNRIAAILENAGPEIDYSHNVLHGRPSFEIIREADREDCDLIVKGANSSDTAHYDPADIRLMRDSSVPVWLVKSKPSPLYERVLVAIDPFAEFDEEAAMNDRLMDIGASLADWENAELYVVAACDLGGGVFRSEENLEEFESHAEEASAQGRQYLADMICKLGETIPEDRIAYRDGEAETVIVDFAREIDADVIVMGTLTRNSIEGLLMGNTASAVLRRVRRSVLTVRANRK